MNRKGSALLIVLGMMAFMVVSAVAFSAYMRYSRLPSSYLRRTSSSRQLVKAALAEAIDAVDRAILNNPHPGVGSQSYSGGNKNIWYGRVLCATNELAEARETVSVLSLEGLAYVPPSLVNEVRYYSRRTPTAVWENFWYDSGRYAFCAVDVSDYFDINRMFASKPRSSAANRRISLSYLFENADHTSQGQDPSPWDNTFMDKFRDVDEETEELDYTSKCPLVSLADFNLALGESGVCGMLSPFARYFSGGGTAGFYGSDSQDESELFRRMTFVTDSLEAEEKRDTSESAYTGEKLDLSGDGQPFDFDAMGSSGPRGGSNIDIMKIATHGSKGAARLRNIMPTLGMVSLFDYLDEDRVPVSLACPTVERAPMCCAIKPNFNDVKFSVLQPEEPAVKADEGLQSDANLTVAGVTVVWAQQEYYISPDFGMGLNTFTLETLYAYPFAHQEGVPTESFTFDGVATVFFALDSKPVTMRTSQPNNNNGVFRFKGNYSEGDSGLTDKGTMVLPLKPPGSSKNFGSVVNDEQDALDDTVTFKATVAPSSLKRFPLMRLKYRWNPTWVEDENKMGGGDYLYKTLTSALNAREASGLELVEAECGVPPITPEGVADPDFTDRQRFLNIVKGGGAKVRMNVSVALRVKNSNDKTVDLVPAHFVDDETLNSIRNWSAFGPASRSICGSRYPIMKFSTDVEFVYSKEGMESLVTAKPATLSQGAVMIDDPRYNYAPESWYTANSISKQDWLNGNESRNRAGDIFMATSDQGYMQSIYELSFIPQLSDLTSHGGDPQTGDYDSLENADNNGAFGGKNNAHNRHLMWRTYMPFGDDRDDFENTGFVAGGKGVKVNPYSDSTNILMAAFANTPISWRLASTNNSEVSGLEPGGSMTSQEFNKKYVWNEFGGEVAIDWDDLEAVASRFRDLVRTEQNWKTAWNKLGWDDFSPDRLCGVDLTGDGNPIWSVDKKFFYGFWRECFAARQQLFLIFVRAEPMMMGGEGIGQTPPQLGARAVALVWRDPNAVTSSNDEGINGYPHRTRVLFYRQLD